MTYQKNVNIYTFKYKFHMFQLLRLLSLKQGRWEQSPLMHIIKFKKKNV